MGSIPDLAALHLWWYRYRILSRRSHVLSERLIPLSLPLFLKGVKSNPVHGEPGKRSVLLLLFNSTVNPVHGFM